MSILTSQHEVCVNQVFRVFVLQELQQIKLSIHHHCWPIPFTNYISSTQKLQTFPHYSLGVIEDIIIIFSSPGTLRGAEPQICQKQKKPIIIHFTLTRHQDALKSVNQDRVEYK